MKTNGDEPITPNPEYGNIGTLGLTKREWMAAMAMQGLLSNPDGVMTEGGSRTFQPIRVAETALKHADALINELNKEI